MVSAEAKVAFFDRAGVINAMDKATHKALARSGALIRKIAIRSIRRTKKKISAPGEPPKTHQPSGLKPSLKEIYYSYDSRKQTVIVGILKYTTKANRDTPGPVPGVLEHGGLSGFYERRSKGGKWVPASRRRSLRIYEEQRVRMVRIAARPTMRPALAKAKPKISELFKLN